MPGQFEIRPFRPEDAEDQNLREDTPTVGMTMTDLSGKVLAFAGIMTWGGMHWTFFNRKEGVHHPVAFYRLTLNGMERCEKLGFTPIYALADTDFATSERWLTKIGFRPLRDDERDDVIRIMEEHTKRRVWVRWQP